MSKSDQWVNIIIVLLILLHVGVLIPGRVNGKTGQMAAVLNAAAGLSILSYWLLRQIQIQQHYVESREIAALVFEVVVIASAVIYLMQSQKSSGLRVMQYVFFGLHLAILVAGLLFMLTFKMKRLF